VNFKRIILTLKISFLLSVFAAATFYFQYAALKKAYSISCSQDQASENGGASLPLAEEESENEKSASEEEEQDEDRVFHHLPTAIDKNSGCSITRSTIHLLDFKEIHFEIVTPPPQVLA
jgi:hypothetical protein